MTSQFFPISLGASVLLLPIFMLSSSSSVKESFFHNSSSSVVMLIEIDTASPLGGHNTLARRPTRLNCYYMHESMRALRTRAQEHGVLLGSTGCNLREHIFLVVAFNG